MVSLFFLRVLHLSGEFLQVSQQTLVNDFSYRYWAVAGWSRWVDSPILLDVLYARKQQKQGDPMGECRPPIRCLSQLFLQRK